MPLENEATSIFVDSWVSGAQPIRIIAFDLFNCLIVLGDMGRWTWFDASVPKFLRDLESNTACIAILSHSTKAAKRQKETLSFFMRNVQI